MLFSSLFVLFPSLWVIMINISSVDLLLFSPVPFFSSFLMSIFSSLHF